jgi:short-subunit dehydrogenase
MLRLIEFILFPPKWFNKRKFRKKNERKCILITGASYGIGEETALLFSKAKTHLILVARSKDKLEEVRAKCEENGAKVTNLIADLYKEEDCKLVCEYIEKKGKEIDIFISNAGKSIRRSFFDSLEREHDFTRTMQLNYHVPIKIILNWIKVKKSEAVIINISALNVLFPPQPLWAGYQASKTAFDQWIRSVKPECRTKNIKISTLYLPLVRTRMIEPTSEYRNVPTMKPSQVAKVIGNRVLFPGSNFKPWWFYFVVTFVFLFSPVRIFFKKANNKRLK